MTGTYAQRRARALDRLGPDTAMILPAAPERIAGRDSELRYLADSDLYYLTGYPEPEAVAVLCPSHEAAPFTLFVRPRDPERELWTGVRGGVEAATERFGAGAAHPIGELEQRLPKMVAGADTLLFRLGGGREDVERLVRQILIDAQKGRQRKGRGPHALLDPGAILDEMRLRKDAHEIEAIRRAAAITADAVREGAAAVRPGAGEWLVEAAIDAGFRRRGADGPAFATIVASGANATVLHYIENRREMQAGELVLVDAGALWAHYAGDLSRTFPVSGRFDAAQRDLYDAVLAARDAAISAVRPGAGFADIHTAALRVLLEKAAALGLLEGDLDELLQTEDEERQKVYKSVIPHQTSHWLGLDVHDVGTYAVGGEPRPLEPGMVLTVEPGLYVPPTLARAAAGLRGVGIRIEDDVLVTDSGHEVLTAALPAGAEEVEGLVGR